MRTAAPCSITARGGGGVPSARPPADCTASLVHPSAEPSSYPQTPPTRQLFYAAPGWIPDSAYICAQQRHACAYGYARTGGRSLHDRSRHWEFQKGQILASVAEWPCL